MLPALLGASLIAFVLGAIAPGDPAVESLRQGPYDEPNPAAVAALRLEWGLDKPSPIRFGVWLGRVVRGDLGTSYFSHRSVRYELASRVPATLLLAIVSLFISVLAGITGGMLCATHPQGSFDRIALLLCSLFASLPVFVLAVLLMLIFSEHLRWLPTSGYGGWKHLILPAVALSVGESARLLRLTRAGLIEALSGDYVRTARARGLAERKIIIRHALPNVLLVVLTAVGLHFGAILGGSAIIEVIFAWPGIGRLAVDSITRRDYPVIQGFVLLSAVVYAVINVVIDLLYLQIDPRLRDL